MTDDQPKRLKYSEYAQNEQALFAVAESEADLGLPKGNHYLLYGVLRRILGVHTTKETMKDVARKALDNGFDPD
jgi:hypothetical protein